MKIDVTVDGIPQLTASFEKVRKGFTDLKGVWVRVRQKFFKIEKEIFSSEGGATASGKWQKLSSPYAEIKQRKYGNKPILQASGKMHKQLTSQPASIEESDQEMVLGFDAPAGFHRTGTNAPATRKRAYSGSAVMGPHRGGMPRRDPFDLTEAQKDEIVEPIRLRLRQILDNERLRSLQ